MQRLVFCNVMYNSSPVQDEKEIQHLLALSQIAGIGPVTARKILQEFGCASEFFAAWERGSGSVLRKGPLQEANVWPAVRKAEQEMKRADKHNISMLGIHEPDYPRRLRACDDSPLVLFCRGRLHLNAPRMISVVGTRNATHYGVEVTESLVHEIQNLGGTVVSGLAYGIDTAAHRAALQVGAQNIGVLAHGLDRVYPTPNQNLASRMEENGGLVSDFPTQTRPDRTNFPMRNRIIAGLCDALVVVEAGETGGALITAGFALGYNRDVFAVPGRIGDTYATGCNRLIRNNKAAILSSVSDFAWHLGWQSPDDKRKATHQLSLAIPTDDNEEKLLDAIRKGVQDLDLIALHAEMAVGAASATLLSMEFKGMVKSLPGKRFALTGTF